MATPLQARLKARLSLASTAVASLPVPPPARRSITGFPPHTDKVEGLPAIERFMLQFLIEWVIETHLPGAFPVTAIECIGHADRDDARGQTYELDISKRRSRAVMEFIRSEIVRITWNDAMRFFIPQLPGGGMFFKPPTVSARIAFDFSGVGSKYAKTATSEEQRLRNRRVTIVFTRSRPQPSPRPPPVNIWLDPKEVCKIIGIACPDHTPRPPYFMDAEYPKKDDYAAFLKWLRKSPARHIDLKPFIEGAIDSFNPPHGAEEKGAEQFERATEATIENEAEVRQRTAEAPGNPDAPDEETEAPPTKYRHIQRPLYQQN